MGSDLAAKLSIPQRMRSALKRGPLTVAALADELGVDPNSISVNVGRGPRVSDVAAREDSRFDGVYRIGLLAEGR